MLHRFGEEMKHPRRIRMYRQGLGDCFLLTSCTDEHDATSHRPHRLRRAQGHDRRQDTTMQAVAAERPRRRPAASLDRLVVTHEHWDHVSGFVQARTI